LGKIAQPVVEGANIVYQTQVVEIRGKSTSPHGRVSVVAADGRVLEFDELIVTTPLGWLKQNIGAFHPSLPDRLTRGIQSIGYGSLEKVYISFPKAFWLTGERALSGFCHWLSPNYEPKTNPHRWVNESLELGSLEGADGHATLLFYINGDESRHITSKVRSLPEGKEREEFLFAFFKPYYSRLPSYNEGNSDCQPNACMSTDWLGDDFAGNGSYSNFQVGLEQGDQDIITMRAGVPEEGIWLAGEHTAPFTALGTVAGAYLSGENVAKRIVAASN
jgi:monoamine oxidase